MPYIASFDIGTTNAKGVLVSRDGRPAYERNVPIITDQKDNQVEQNPEQWFEAVAVIVGEWLAAGVKAEDIALVAMSGQMQDCIPIGLDDRPVRPAILYSDGRAAEQAERLKDELGTYAIRKATGNHMDGTLTFPKLLWLKENEPETFSAASVFLISAKDYVLLRLTGCRATDPTSAATTGLMNLAERRWETAWLERCGIAADRLPPIVAADETAGFVTAEAAAATGLAAGTPVLCGIGDAGAATIGAGVTRSGEMYAYIGTTGWVATPTRQVAYAGEGVFHLAHAERGMYIAVAPLTNAGSAHKWAASVLSADAGGGEAAIRELEERMAACDRGANDVVFLPYLNGERCPVQDPLAAGCFVGLRPSTTKEDMGCAVLEGVAMGMRQLMELVASPADKARLTLIGGGSKSAVWNQIIADILEMEVVVPREAQYLPSLGAAALGFVNLGWDAGYAEFLERAQSVQEYELYKPNPAYRGHYRRKYDKYVMLYPALQPVFHKQ